jgi:hypothetical protein
MIGKNIEDLIRPGMGMRTVQPSPHDYDYWNGRLLVYEAPRQGFQYTLGVDPAMGVGRDRSVIQVIRNGTRYIPDEQVAEFACDWLDPVEFAGVVAAVGKFYCDDMGEEALGVVEANADCGDTVITDLRGRFEYGNLFIWKQYDKRFNALTTKLGWWTNATTRPKLIARGLHYILSKDLIMNSPFLLDEWQDFQKDHWMAKQAAKSGAHDDRVMALLIGFWGAHDEEWIAGEDLAEERRLLANAQEVVHTVEVKSNRKATFQNTHISAKDMWASWDALMED